MKVKVTECYWTIGELLLLLLLLLLAPLLRP
jgi:hypothetical protein